MTKDTEICIFLEQYNNLPLENTWWQLLISTLTLINNNSTPVVVQQKN